MVASGVHQCPTDPTTLRRADDGDHLAFALGHVVGEQADGPPAVGGHEAGEDGGIDRAALAGHVDASEGVLQPKHHPRPVGALYEADSYHRVRMIPFLPRWANLLFTRVRGRSLLRS